MPSLQDIATITSLVVGVGGFLFGFYQWRVNQRDKEPNIRIRLTEGTHQPFYLTDKPTGSPKEALFIEVTNIGQVPVPLSSLGFRGKQETIFEELKDDSNATSPIVPPHSPPYLIERDYQLTIEQTGENHKNGKGWIRAIVSIPTGKKFYSNKLKITQPK